MLEFVDNIIANEKIEECKELKAKSAGLQGEVDSLKYVTSLYATLEGQKCLDSMRGK